MRKAIFLFVFMIYNTGVFAQQKDLFLGQTNEEIQLLTELSARRQELDQKAQNLDILEKELKQTEKQNQDKAIAFAKPIPRNIQIYMNMKPSKVAALLDKKPILEAKYILNQMPAIYAARILNQMDEAKAALLIDQDISMKD